MIKDKKGSNNVIVDHLSRIKNPSEEKEEIEIEENVPNEQLFRKQFKLLVMLI